MLKKMLSLGLVMCIGIGIGMNIDKVSATAVPQITNNVKIEINGKKFVPKDKGEKMDILMHNNRIYLPVRSVGEAIDAEISWNQAKQTVIIKTYW